MEVKERKRRRGETELMYGEERDRMSVWSCRNKLAVGSVEEKGDFFLKAGRMQSRGNEG